MPLKTENQSFSDTLILQVVISGPNKAVLGINTQKNKKKVSMQRIVNESDYSKKRNASEAKKIDHGNEESILFEKYQGTGALNYKQIFIHLFEIYTVYITVETFILLYTFHASCFCN